MSEPSGRWRGTAERRRGQLCSFDLLGGNAVRTNASSNDHNLHHTLRCHPRGRLARVSLSDEAGEEAGGSGGEIASQG